MTDLNSLFLINAPMSSRPVPSMKAYNSYQQPSMAESRSLFGQHPQQSASFQTLHTPPLLKPSSTFFTTPLTRSQRQLSKTTLQNHNMFEQISYFKMLSQQQFFKKCLFVLIPLLMSTLFGLISSKVCFELMLLAASVLVSECLIVEMKTLQLFIRTLPPLAYTALFYDILTEGDLGGHYYIALANLPALLISSTATINFIIMSRLFFLSQQNLRSAQIHQTPIQIIIYYIRSYMHKIRKNATLALYLLTINLALALVFVLYCIVNLQATLFKQTLFTIPAGVVIFVLLDVFVYAVEFLAREISLFKLKKHFYQLQLCISLLRLKPSIKFYQQNAKIHKRCLLEISKQLKHNGDFLQTPVKVNYTINTYRDIFEIYAFQQLSLLHSTINGNILKLIRNNKIIKSTKSIKQDIFIHFRKLYAKVQNNYLVFKILEEIQRRKMIFLIMVRLYRESPLRTRILEMLNEVRESANKATDVQECVGISKRKLADWIKQLQTLQKYLRNGAMSMRTTNVTERDENGWAHYRRPHLDMQSI